MKKSMFWVALAAVSLASCSHDEVVELNNKEIKFTLATEKISRASSADGQGVFCNEALMPNFQLTANYDGKVYIENDQYVNPGTASAEWTNATNVRYWPELKDGEPTTMNFFASYNAKGNTVTSDGTKVTMSFDVAEAVADQVDLVYAAKIGASIPNASLSGADPVALNFRHALSQIVFQAKNTNNSLHVVVESAAVGNVATTGTFTFNTTESTDENWEEHSEHGDSTTTDNLDTEYAALKGLGTWATQGVKRYEIDFADVTLDGNSDEVFDLTVKNDDGLTYSKDAMLLLPTNNGANKANTSNYTAAAWNPSGDKPGTDLYNGTYLAVKCKIYNIANPDATAENGGYVAGDVCLHDGYAVIPVEFSWKQGKKYVYTFVFGDGNGGYEDDPDDPKPVLVPMSFTVTVDDFMVKNEGHKDMETK